MLHIIQNDPEVPPGNLPDFLTAPYIVDHPYRDGILPEPDRISALIVLGGAMGANDDGRYPFLTDLKNLIRATVAARIPYLGICLGGQLLAAAMGGRVVSNRWEELGTLPVELTPQAESDQLFRGAGEQFESFQWHHDSFDLPEGAVLLASSSACPNQAFRLGENAWGLQFHPEVTEEIIRCWAAWDSSTAVRIEDLVSAFKLVHENYYSMTGQLMRRFLQLVIPIPYQSGICVGSSSAPQHTVCMPSPPHSSPP